MKAKPILFILGNAGVPCDEDFSRIDVEFKDKFPDYRVLMCFQDKPEKDCVEVRVFNGDDITDVQFEELKKIVQNER